MFTGFGGFLMFSLDEVSKKAIIEKAKSDAIIQFGVDKVGTEELRVKLSESERSQILSYLFNRAEELAMEALLK